MRGPCATKAMQVRTTLTAKTKAGQPVAIWKTTDNGEIYVKSRSERS